MVCVVGNIIFVSSNLIQWVFFPTFKTEDGWSIGTSVCGTQFLVTRDGPQNPMAGIDRLAQKHGIQAAESHGFLHLGS